MKTAHVESLQLLATPFRESTEQPFAFGPGSTWAGITSEIRERIPTMLHHRLTPPPRETYSLNRCVYAESGSPTCLIYFMINRKLSGAFLLASRLRATVDSKKLWDDVVDSYKFSTDV